jgi:hypothetical protein
MLTLAAETFFHAKPNKDLQAEFNRVIKRLCDPASGRRNDLAHGMIVGEDRKDRMHYFVVPPLHSSRKRDFKSEPAYKYTSTEIEYFTKHFRFLAGEIHRLGFAIGAARATSPKTGHVR